MKLGRLSAGIGLLIAASAAQAQAGEQACSALATWSGGAADLVIDASDYSTTRSPGRFGGPQPLPAHCHVTGSFEHRTGADGRDYAIRFAINMPDNWNGRFMFQGGGGLNGSVGEPLGTVATGSESALARGFAVVSTDSGHVGSVFDSSFMADQQAMLNFQYQANAKVVELTRPMVESYYAAPVEHSYFVGCSTGGREGMIMAQRFPQLFDGIISGAPAMRTGVSNLALRWISVELGKAENTDARDPFTESEERLIMGSLLDRCDALDGQADGLIFNRSACDFDPRDLACSANPGSACLADDKAAALARAIGGPVNSAGLPVYVPFPWDGGLDDPASLPGLLLAGGSPPEGGNGADMQSQNVDAEYIAATLTEEAIGATATQYNVSSFIAGGGKHIFYHGEGDAWFSANDTVRYFETMAAADANAAVQPVEEYGRLYLVPGMAHCSGGEHTLDSFDLLTPLVEWVENGTPPAAVTATGASMPGQSRPLCPYPGYATYSAGDPALAASFSCAAP